MDHRDSELHEGFAMRSIEETGGQRELQRKFSPECLVQSIDGIVAYIRRPWLIKRKVDAPANVEVLAKLRTQKYFHT